MIKKSLAGVTQASKCEEVCHTGKARAASFKHRRKHFLMSLKSSQKRFLLKVACVNDVLLMRLSVTYLFFLSFLALISMLEFEKGCICFLNFNLGASF
jgi:hypothetical protein